MTYNNISSAGQPEEQSVLSSLRSLVPQRHLNLEEGKHIAELQANRFRSMFGIDSPVFPHEAIMELPKIKVAFDTDLPVSGSAHWSGTHWIIVLNALEGGNRQRFSLAHEFKHILDHTRKEFLYHDGHGNSAAKQAEQVADYFAGCLFMPKQHIKRLYYEGLQQPSELSEKFQVSPTAIHFRLQQLNIVGQSERCNRFGIRPTYYREKSLVGALA